MKQITLNEEDKKRIQRYIEREQEAGFYGYKQDIALLEKDSILTEKLAREVFSMVMSEAHRQRNILTLKENDEFFEQMNEVYSKYDKIPKPEQLEEDEFYAGEYGHMELEDVYENMQVAFEVLELATQYYTCKELRDIANKTINSINGIDKYKIKLQPEEKKELQEIQEELKNLLAHEKTDIQSIQDRLDKYNTYAMNIWNDYLTSVDDTKSSEYRWVVHNLTKGELQGEFRDKYMSTSILTNNAMGLYGIEKYGLIIKPVHIVSASYADSSTRNTSEDEENLFIRRPSIMLPQEIEEICMQQTIEVNGELLNYDKKTIYPEIVVDEYEIEGVYYISNGEHELAKNYESARKMADERGLPLIERDISRYRSEHGLEPMTEGERRNLCKDILLKCCNEDKELEKTYSEYYYDFVETHFQEFYEQYMKLKEQEDYSRDDILKVFAEIARDDIHFNKIPQIVEEMYLTDEEKKERRYGINNISDRENLQHRLENIISEGIQYSARKGNPDAQKKFEEIKTIFPQFEEFKDVYLQLRVAGIEDELYKGVDYKTVSYAELLERAKIILKEQEELKQKSEMQQYESKQEHEQVEMAGTEVETMKDTTDKIEQDSSTDVEINELEGTTIKESTEVGKTEERIRPKEESVRDEVGDEVNNIEQQQIQVANPQTTDVWLRRFNSWYSAIDRVKQNVKVKFVKMKYDIIKVISEKMKERGNQQKINKEQEQNER